MDPNYSRRRSSPSMEGSAEYLTLVSWFAHWKGLCLPSSVPGPNSHIDCDFEGLTDDQTLFLSFLEAMVIRFTRLFRPHVVPVLPGTDVFLSHPSWSVRKIGQWCQFLDRSSLTGIFHCHRLVDYRDQLLSSIASVTLGSCPKVAATILPLTCSSGFAEDLQSKSSVLLPEDFRFAYPRSLLHLI